MVLVALTRVLLESSGKQGYPRAVEKDSMELFKEGEVEVEIMTG